MNSSFVKPASAIISMSGPRLISLCFGMGTTYSFFTRIKWLPFCLTTLNPTLTRTLTTSCHESRGSFDKNFDLFSFSLLP